ncbi:MAG: hypothetical protein WC290_03125 [archaeon]|jgi:DNA polymerase elongation subunit (family B)|nr:hypothetical protein [Sphaerochaetaceae bacterium]
MRMRICSYCGHQIATEDLNCFSDMHEGCYRKVIRELDEERDRLKSKKRKEKKKRNFLHRSYLILLFYLKKQI